MGRYYDIDKLAEMCRAKADTLIEGKEAFLYVAKWLELLPAADVVPKSEVENLEYTLLGVMHSVDKWLEGDELEQDEVNRAVTMREKTLRIVENAKAEPVREIFEKIERYLAQFSHIHRYAEEANAVTEEYANGDPVEMTSVWDACRLEHNGYDDYETMCKLQDNIGNIAKSSLLKELEGDFAVFKKKYTKGAD